LERMAPYFPFLPSPLVRRDVQASIHFDWHLCFACSYPPLPRGQIEQALQDLNVIYCELTSLIILAYTTRDVILSNTKRRDGRSLRIQISQVKDYVARLLSGVQMASHLVGRPITAQDYVALFPTLWMLLNSMSEHSDVDNGVDIFRALLDHSMQVSSAAAAKRPTVDFLARLTLVSFLFPLRAPFDVLSGFCLARYRATVYWHLQSQRRCGVSSKD
jgi:hypothetical protein